MAVCEIWDVKGRLDHPIDYAENPEKTANPKYTEADLQALVDVMEYATNKDKTEKRFFVTGVNCDTATARDEMMIAKAEWNDESEIVCYHGFQSFKHGEVTPEVAHEVGVKLAEKMWGDRFQVIVATHLNTECLHNHFVVNSVSFLDGKHYHDNKANLRLLRQRSDELCREYALSVIEHPSGKKKPYASDADKKILMNALLEKVEIFKEKQADGRWVKSVQFKIPLNIDGKLVDTMFFDNDEYTENSLSNEKHVETVVLLSHKKPDGHINVKVEFGEGEGKVPLDNIAKRAEEYKPKERVTYKMIKEYIEAKYGFKVHTAYIAEVKRDLGLPMYDAPNAVEELKQPRKHPTVEKVEAIKDALKHFEVI